VTTFKKGLFAKCHKTKIKAKEIFIRKLLELKIKREMIAKSALGTQQMKQENASLQKLERMFTLHFIENEKNQKLLKKEKELKFAAAVRMKMKEEGVVETVVAPKYKLDNRLKVYREVSGPSSEVYTELGFDSQD